ncbi:MAG: cupin domain-containing protein [Ignavibacteriaceae bacterium]|jgi:ethanolamine utilization protein EutQ|nr:cupin domain-containing protein [Ignavibacteriaceae bacterium]
MKKLISANIVQECYKEGLKYIYVDDKKTIITSEARDLAQKYNIKFNYCSPVSAGSVENSAKTTLELIPVIVDKIASKLEGSDYNKDEIAAIVCKYLEKENEAACNADAGYISGKAPNGLKVVKGNSVKLKRFEDAGKDKNVNLLDVITYQDGSPMSAGIMSWKKEDSFQWELTYDEVDYVIEGELEITIDGQVFSGKQGDIFYIPKGSKIIFGTPGYTKIMYVTYPANWSA